MWLALRNLESRGEVGFSRATYVPLCAVKRTTLPPGLMLEKRTYPNRHVRFHGRVSGKKVAHNARYSQCFRQPGTPANKPNPPSARKQFQIF